MKLCLQEKKQKGSMIYKCQLNQHLLGLQTSSFFGFKQCICLNPEYQNSMKKFSSVNFHVPTPEAFFNSY